MDVLPFSLDIIGSANERRRYIVTSSLIGRAHAQNGPQLYAISCYIGPYLETLLYDNSDNVSQQDKNVVIRCGIPLYDIK